MSGLTLIAFPQHAHADGAVDVRVLALPTGDPFVGGPGPAFADADLQLELRLITSLEHWPKPADPFVSGPWTAALERPRRASVLQAVQQRFPVTPGIARPAAPAGTARVRKHLVSGYMQAAGIGRPRTPFASVDGSYRCWLEEDAPLAAEPPVATVSWGQALAWLLRQPVLAREAGLLYEGRFMPPAGALEAGGWLYVAPAAASPWAAVPAPLLECCAARMPPLAAGQARAVFAPTVFPLHDVDPAEPDAVHADTASWDDGFAKLVHAAQPVSGSAIDTEPGASPPPRDAGMRIGWDDEQLAIWLNRQLGFDALTGALRAHASRHAVRAFRVDVRPAGAEPAAPWFSLNRARGPVRLGELDLGEFDGELDVEVVPVARGAVAGGDFWLPAYPARWGGGSIVLSDAFAHQLTAVGGRFDGGPFEPLAADAPALRYGHRYDFRVRLVDLSGGGPDWTVATPETTRIAHWHFRRWLPPRPVRLVADERAPDGRSGRLVLGRPRLCYPEAVYASDDPAAARDALLAVRAALIEAGAEEEPAIPDPDVAAVRLTLDVRSLDGDPDAPDGWLRVWQVERPFAAAADTLTVDVVFVDLAQLAELPPPAGDAPLQLPAAREVRLSIVAVGREDPALDYWGSEAARSSALAEPVSWRAAAVKESPLLLPAPPERQIRGLLLQPGGSTLTRIANELGLRQQGQSLSGAAGERTVFACSSALRHTLAPGAASLHFATAADLALQWVVALGVELDRDWTWQGAASPAFELERRMPGGPLEAVATLSLPLTLDAAPAVQPARDGRLDRTRTVLWFFDAISPLPAAGSFPAELAPEYTLRAHWRQDGVQGQQQWQWQLRLPAAAKPVQTPRLVSAGLAAAPYAADAGYRSTEPRERGLWLEFDGPPADPGDRYFARVLALAPDPQLLAPWEPPAEPPAEPALALPDEALRVITPGQSRDDAGLLAMQQLQPAEDHPGRWLLPLPPGLDPQANELFGLWTYELRVGHDASRWCTAQARFGPPLRVTGLQHAAPPLAALASRTHDEVHVAAAYATPVAAGRVLRPVEPRSDLWALLYAQVLQADGSSFRNVLLQRRRLQPPAPPHHDDIHGRTLRLHGHASFSQRELSQLLAGWGPPADTGCSVLVAELVGPPYQDRDGRPRADPLGAYLGEMRLLRASCLVPLGEMCGVHLAA